jgi:hypothetical protein
MQFSRFALIQVLAAMLTLVDTMAAAGSLNVVRQSSDHLQAKRKLGKKMMGRKQRRPSRLPSVNSPTLSDVSSLVPSDAPSMVPSDAPSMVPSDAPSMVPSDTPSEVPAFIPSLVCLEEGSFCSDTVACCGSLSCLPTPLIGSAPPGPDSCQPDGRRHLRPRA